MSKDLYVHYGCGLDAPDSWINFDTSPTLRLQRIPLIGRAITWRRVKFPRNVRVGDIIKGLPIPPDSCKGLYCSHILEHLSLEDCRRALRNSIRCLAPGGRFRLVMPDLATLVRSYANSKDSGAALRLMRNSGLATEVRLRGVRGFLNVFSNAHHLWLWDYPSIEAELRTAGFKDIRRAEFGDSVDPQFSAVEHPKRWENALGVECSK